MYKHFKQINPLCCGAACMQMVYERFGISISQEKIWNYIKRDNEHTVYDCGPEQMQQHFHEHGLCALYNLVIHDIDLFLCWVMRYGLSAIINYSITPEQNHFVVFEGLYENGIAVQDPSADMPNTFIPFEQLIEPQVMLIAKPEHMLPCPHCGKTFPSNNVLTWLYARHVARCAYCNRVIYQSD